VLDVMAFSTAWVAGFLLSVSMTVMAAIILYQPAPPVERVIEYRYSCPSIYETHIPYEYEFSFITSR
jgi:hypothetical protein